MIEGEWLHRQSNANSRGWLKRYCEEQGLDYNATKQKLYRYKKKLANEYDKKPVRAKLPPKSSNPKPKPKKKLPLVYDDFIQFCKDHPEIPFADVVLDRCEGLRKRDRATVKAVLSILRSQ